MRTLTVFKGALVLALLVLVPAPGSAQSQGSQHGYVVGLGGTTATEVTAPFFGASAGFNVTRHLQITADVGRMQDVLPKFTGEDLSTLDQGVNRMSGQYGMTLASTVKMPTNYLTGGVRVPFFVGRYARPYVSVSAGLAHMSPKPTFKYTYAGTTQDITDEVMNAERSGCMWTNAAACVTPSLREETRPMASAGAGVAVTVARHVTFDVGYKYSGIFIETNYLQDLVGSPHSHTRIDTHRVFAGAGVTF